MKQSFIFILIFLTGCAANDYTCGEVPEGSCESVAAVYEKNLHGLAGSRKQSVNEAVIRIAKSEKILNYAIEGDPVLTEPVVGRVLLNSYVDKDGDWHSGRYIYLKLKDAQWKTQ